MTRKMIFAASAASLALATPAWAEKGGHGGGHGDDGGRQAESRAQPGPRAERQQERQEQRQMMRVERQQAPRFERAPQFERQEARRMERPERFDRAPRFERIERQAIERAQRGRGERVERERLAEPRFERHERRQAERMARIERVERERAAPEFERIRTIATRAAAGPQGLPHLLGRHDMRALRADAARRIAIGERFQPTLAQAPVPLLYASRYADTPQYYYRYDDDRGYLYRVDRGDNLIRAMIPLFGGYGTGDPWPTTYGASYVPNGYRDLYYDTPDYRYRSDGLGIYQVDAKTSLITALVALLTGSGFGVGQMLPASYSAYNVPLAYRGSYADTADSWYRYGDGYIYQVDPYSRRIEQRYPLYADDYAIGSAWPTAYPDYNVPDAYRSMYADTPQYQYRYANGGIYQVDPTTQLITAVVALLSGQRFAVGQPMPAGYGTYNVPYAYRGDYYDTASDMYRYADGTIWRVDPRTGLIEDSIPVYG